MHSYKIRRFLGVSDRPQLFIGTLALLVSLIRIVLNHFTNKHHVGFESAIWYWHFVEATARLLFLIALLYIL